MGQDSRAPSGRWVTGIFAIILVLAALARFAGLLQHSTAPDEAFTFFVASHDVGSIFFLLKNEDFHPPLVYLLGHLLFGFTHRAYLFRIATALVGVMGVAATYALARRLLGGWALAATALVGLNAVLVFFDGFFRMYALLWSLAMLSWAALFWALDEPRRWLRWLAYGLALTGLLYTQYLAFFTLAAHCLYALVFARKTVGFWASVAASLAAFAPWVPAFLVQYPLGGTSFNHLAGHLIVLLHLPSVLVVDGIPAYLEYSLVTIALLWLGLLAGLAIAVWHKEWKVLALFTPIVLQTVYSLVSGKLLFGQRYFLLAVVPLIFLYVVVFRWLWGSRLRVAGLAGVAAFGILTVAGTIDKHFLSPFMPVDWTAYSKFLNDKIQPGDAIVFDDAMVYYPLYGTPATTGRRIFMITNPTEAKRYGAQASRLGRVWFVGYQTEESDPDLIALKALMRTHPGRRTWRTTTADYGDVIFTTLLWRPAAKRGP